MRSRTFAVALIGLSIVAAAHASLKSEIEALNKPLAAALMKGDVDQFKKIVQSHTSPDLVYIEGDTVSDFAQMIWNIRQQFSQYVKMTNVAMKVLSVKERGANGMAVGRQTLEGIVAGRDKKPHRVTYVEATTDTYRKVGGLWKMVKRAMWTEKSTRDGKPMPIGGPKRPKSGGIIPHRS